MSPVSNPLNTGSRETRDQLFAVLSNHRRRYALHAVQESDGEATLSDIAEQVAAWEYNKSIPELTSTERKRVYTSLQQHHLSQLEDAGLIEIEHDVISTTPAASNMRIYLDVVPAQNIPWALYYLCLSIIGGFSFLLIYLEWLPEQVTPLTLAGAFIAIFFISALAHYLQSRDMQFGADNLGPESSE